MSTERNNCAVFVWP